MSIVIQKWTERLSKMTGRLALTSEPEAQLLTDVAGGCKGDHLEIGCLWGGTAILAALAKRHGRVITVDPMIGGWWDTCDPVTNTRPTPGAVLDNFHRFGVAHKISIIKAPFSELLLPEGYQVDTALIDGDHNFGGATYDWKLLSKITKKYILVHDYNSKKHPGVARMVDEIASKDPDWRMFAVADSLASFVRVYD